MNHLLAEAWANIARLQKARAASTNEAALQAFDLMIDRQIDRIAAGHAEPDDSVETSRAVSTAIRRERHRARLVRLYFVEPRAGDQTQGSAFTLQMTYAAREALNAIFAQSSPEDAALLLRVGQGEAPQGPGLSAAAARKRLCRLRARFAHLSLNAA
jgi:hypothetical protein